MNNKPWMLDPVGFVFPYQVFALFRHCPSLFKHVGELDSILESWKEYKMAVPTYGAILLDPTLQFVSFSSHCLLDVAENLALSLR